MNNAHPLRLDPEAVRLVEHNLLDIETMIGADSFTLDGSSVVFRRRPAGAAPARSWTGRLGDWLVRDGAGFWRIVSDETVTLDAALTAPGDAPQR